MAVATNTRQTGSGVLDQTEKTGAENIHSRVEVKSVPIARVSNPTTYHREILMSNTKSFHILKNNLSSTEQSRLYRLLPQVLSR